MGCGASQEKSIAPGDADRHVGFDDDDAVDDLTNRTSTRWGPGGESDQRHGHDEDHHATHYDARDSELDD